MRSAIRQYKENAGSDEEEEEPEARHEEDKLEGEQSDSRIVEAEEEEEEEGAGGGEPRPPTKDDQRRWAQPVPNPRTAEELANPSNYDLIETASRVRSHKLFQKFLQKEKKDEEEEPLPHHQFSQQKSGGGVTSPPESARAADRRGRGGQHAPIDFYPIREQRREEDEEPPSHDNIAVPRDHRYTFGEQVRKFDHALVHEDELHSPPQQDDSRQYEGPYYDEDEMGPDFMPSGHAGELPPPPHGFRGVPSALQQQ